jgi:hypothetical protein
MARRTTAKKTARKGATKKAARKGPAKKVARKATAKAAVKKATRKAPAKKRTRNPLATATAAHQVAEKKLTVAKKAYDRAVVAEALAAEKRKKVNEKIAQKAVKQRPSTASRTSVAEA